MHPCEVENVLDHEAQGFPDPCPVAQLQHHFTSWASSDPWLQESESRNWLLPFNAQQNKPHSYLCHSVPPNYSDFADFPQYFSSESLWLQQQTWFGTARVKKHFRNQNAALFQRICHCPWNHNLSSRASKAVCSTCSFLVSRLEWVLIGMGEAELPAEVLGCVLSPPHLPVTSRLKAQHSHSSCQPNALPSELPVPFLPMKNRNKTHWETKNPINLLKKRWSICSSLLHGTNGLKIT